LKSLQEINEETEVQIKNAYLDYQLNLLFENDHPEKSEVPY
jgi:hypothetical protein